MAVYIDSFGTSTTGAAPSGWTPRWTTSSSTWVVRALSTATAGKYLEHTATTANHRLLSFDAVDGDGGRADAEIFVRYWSNSNGASQFYLIARASGAAGSENGYIFYNSSSGLRIAKIVAGTLTTIASVSFSLSASTWYSIRFRVNGSTLKARIWASAYTADEPTAWNIETTDGSITAAGWVGIGSATTAGTRAWDDVAVGTGGDAAVFPTAEAVRETVIASLTLTRSDSDAQATQFAALVLGAPAPPERITQYAGLALVEYDAAIPVTQLAALVLADHVPCVTRWAQCWTITRTDGEVFAFTSLDEPMAFRGVVHQPCASLSATAAEQSTTLGQSGNVELLGLISDVGISERDVFNGVFDFAFVEVWLVPWDNAGGETPIRLIAGKGGSMTQTQTGFTCEVLTSAAELKQRALVETFTPGCRFNFGSTTDARCPVDLAAITVSGSATSTAVPSAANQSTRRILIDATRGEAAGHFDLGRVTFTSGNNAGASSEVKSYSGGVFVLWAPMLYPIEVGDTYTATPGCNKTPADHMRFNADMLDYGGFPDVPGSDSLNDTPDAKG